jgi:hypothetical protein
MDEQKIDRTELARTLLKNVAAEQGWSCEANRARVRKRLISRTARKSSTGLIRRQFFGGVTPGARCSAS